MEFEDKTEQKEKETQEYVDLDLSTEEFFKINFFSRNILINALFNISIFHPRWKKLTLLLTELALLILFISIFLTADENVTTSSISLIILFSLISSMAANVMIYLLNIFFYFPPVKFRKLLYLVKAKEDLNILKAWNDMSYSQGYKAFIGYVICLIIWGVSYYVTFGFTVVWKYQNSAFYLCLIIGAVLEFLIFELVIELLNAFFFGNRRDTNWMRTLGQFINKSRNYRCLSP